MLKKIIANLILTAILSAAVFFAARFVAYKVTVNSAKVDADDHGADWVGEPSGEENSFTAAATTEPEDPVPALDLTGEAPLLPEPEEIEMPDDATWALVLINRFYRIKEGYEPEVAQVLENSAVYLDARVADAFRVMYSAALADGIELTLSAGYVTPERQERKFTKLVKAYMETGLDEAAARARAALTVMPAYCSESNYGLSVDIGWPEADFADSPTYGWLRQNAARFGFTERYPADKTAVTLFHAEPWHWRYVGDRAALEMREKGLCLEEFVSDGSAAALAQQILQAAEATRQAAEETSARAEDASAAQADG